METANKPPPLKIKDNPKVDWQKWYNQFTTFLTASGLDEASDKRKITLLVNFLGEDGQEAMNNFEWEEAEHKTNFARVVQKFKNHCEPFKNIIVERFNFNTIVQREGETFNSFLTELLNKAATCEFGTLKEGLIRDRIVYGIRDKALQKKLLRERNLSYKDCLDLCRAAEESDKQARLLEESVKIEAVKKKLPDNSL